MFHFLASVFLFLMCFPVIISLLAASNFLPIIIWNFVWYYIFGITAEYVFEGASHLTLTSVLILIYVLRVLSGAGASQKNQAFVFRSFRWPPEGRMGQPRGPSIYRGPELDGDRGEGANGEWEGPTAAETKGPTNGENDDDIIDVEVIHSKKTPRE